MRLNLSDTFNKELPTDSNNKNTRRQVFEATHSYVNPKVPSEPELIHASHQMVEAIGLEEKDISSKEFLEIFSGIKIYPKTKPYAMAYAGHQFGNWAGQLGDGRAINLFEVEHDNKRWAVQLKGAGETPYSRQGDGLAVLRSSIREYLCSEAMHYLGVPTTRVLSLMLSGDDVLRDMLYDGNREYEKGAIVARVAPTFIRFGNFELFAARKDYKNLKKLTDYTIKYFYPELGQQSKETYIKFFKEVSKRTLEMIIHWQRVGFVHGVMNTDNMSILGSTIDYGPYGWLEDFDFGWTPNTTDKQNKRYRFGNQPNIGLWNLLQLANALYPLVEEAEPFETILNHYQKDFETQSLQMMRSKLGLKHADEEDSKLITDLEDCLLLSETDMTIFFRLLSDFKKNEFEVAIEQIQEAFYKPEEIKGKVLEQWQGWFKAYDKRLHKETLRDDERKAHMNKVNPKYVLRNYMAQLAIDDANKNDYNLIDELFELLKQPYAEQPENDKWFAKRPDWARHKVGCSMLSCSS
ncbi:protein adenylyltransferase SelO [uncultured Winogradskyella sp.]|uniref:protein adenylyltransferase SelO n=1 Tax=uncultured Winogradskyella sp. TaxID=395353 RepID=UPI00261569B4|nr:YdiU family protein [uncultured Winogradskyella sp.]